jgi:hypothetical protein
LHFSFVFFLLPFSLPFGRGLKDAPSIIGATCAFDAKIYKIVDGIFAVSACLNWDKKKFQISDFCSALSSLLVETMLFRSRRFPGKKSLKIVK